MYGIARKMCSPMSQMHCSPAGWCLGRDAVSSLLAVLVGKSVLLKHILCTLPKDSTFVTASTGLAASALGGTSINAFSGEWLSLLCHWVCFAPRAASALPFWSPPLGVCRPASGISPAFPNHLHWASHLPLDAPPSMPLTDEWDALCAQ